MNIGEYCPSQYILLHSQAHAIWYNARDNIHQYSCNICISLLISKFNNSLILIKSYSTITKYYIHITRRNQRRIYLTESEKKYLVESEKNLPNSHKKNTCWNQRRIYLTESEKYIPLPSMPSSVLVTPCSPSTVFGNNSPLKNQNSVYFNFLYDF